MQKLILFIVSCVSLCFVKGQNVIKWEFYGKKISDTIFELHLKADIQKSWHIYSQETPSGGPLPTKIIFNRNPTIKLIGRVTENGDLEQHYESVFGVDVLSYSRVIDFVQLIRVKPNITTKVSGSVQYMACTNERCLNPKVENFNIQINRQP